MSRAVPAHLAAIEDARLDQAAEAARMARRNQPKGLLVVAGLLLAAMLLYLVFAAFSLQAANKDLNAMRGRAEDAVRYAGELKALRALGAINPAVTSSASQLRTRVEQAGLDAGLSQTVKLPIERAESVIVGLGSRQYKYTYDITDPNLGALLAWVQKSVAAVPGLEVYGIKLKPEPNQWRLTVTFSRWQKTEGSS
jgi:hypothetical protein